MGTEVSECPLKLAYKSFIWNGVHAPIQDLRGNI